MDLDIIGNHTRADAIESGELIEVPAATLAELRFPPTVLTRAAWAEMVAWTGEDTARTGVPQDEDGRLWDVLWMARRAPAHVGTDTVRFTVYRVATDASPNEDGDLATPVTLELTVELDDAGELVFTIGLPGED